MCVSVWSLSRDFRCHWIDRSICLIEPITMLLLVWHNIICIIHFSLCEIGVVSVLDSVDLFPCVFRLCAVSS